MYDALPIAGPYPAPGIVRQSTEEFRQRLIDLKLDAIIAGNGGCGICTQYGRAEIQVDRYKLVGLVAHSVFHS